MNKTAHTPGPWAVSLARTVDGTAMVVGGEGKEFGLIAECTLDADARLIAAAPDLYAEMDPDLLEAIANEIDCFEHSARAGSLRSLAKRQRAALAKAEGRNV